MPTNTVRRVLPHEYPKYRKHLKALDTESRALRFEHPVNDYVIDQLCDKWEVDHDHHVLFCIEDDKLDFIGIGHIALQDGMELAFSVHKEYRGQGMGDKLMSRCIQYCRTHNILKGCMTCLATNSVIKHLCTKHGIHIHSEHGETLADIELEQPNAVTFMEEATARNLGALDYMAKRTRLPWTFLS